MRMLLQLSEEETAARRAIGPDFTLLTQFDSPYSYLADVLSDKYEEEVEACLNEYDRILPPCEGFDLVSAAGEVLTELVSYDTGEEELPGSF